MQLLDEATLREPEFCPVAFLLTFSCRLWRPQRQQARKGTQPMWYELCSLSTHWYFLLDVQSLFRRHLMPSEISLSRRDATCFSIKMQSRNLEITFDCQAVGTMGTMGTMSIQAWIMGISKCLECNVLDLRGPSWHANGRPNQDTQPLAQASLPHRAPQVAKRESCDVDTDTSCPCRLRFFKHSQNFHSS